MGVRLGVSVPTPTPVKSELAGEDPVEAPLDDPKGHHNYPSVADFSKEIRATFAEEVPLGMTIGPLSRQQAAELCGCDPTELCPGPLQESMKGTRSVPSTMDRSGEQMPRSSKTLRNGPRRPQSWTVSMPSTGSMPPDILRPEHVPGLAQECERAGTRTTQPQPGTGPPRTADSLWILLKADVTEAHYLFPQIDWGFVFVDDFCWLLRLPTGPQFTAALLGTLVALGTPLSWKKTHLAEINAWLGFVIHPAI